MYNIIYDIYIHRIWYIIWYGGPARHAALAGRPDFFFEGPRVGWVCLVAVPILGNFEDLDPHELAGWGAYQILPLS